MMWKTECGLYVNSKKSYSPLFAGSCSYLGKTYSAENNNVLIHCPYKEPCEMRNKDFDNVKIMYGMCCISKTDDPYDYEKSIEKIKDDNDAIYYLNLEKLYEKNPLYRGCGNVGRKDNEVKITYDLSKCLLWRNGCDKPVCAVTGKKRDLTLVNIFCDIKYTVDKGMLTEHEAIRKGIKLLSSPIMMECAERKLKELENKDEWYWRSHKSMMKPYKIYISKRATKDLMQDLQDAKEGIEVHHDSDLKKKAAQEKRERKEERQKKKQLKKNKVKIEQVEQLSILDSF